MPCFIAVDRIMTTSPELIIGYKEDGTPASAACSLCGEWMPEDYSEFASSAEIVSQFTEHFRHHVREKHPPRWIN
jgi:hypothetical protein